MKSIFLTSSFADVVNLFKEYKNEDLQGKTITFIPTASIHEDITFYVEAGRKALESIGLVVDILEISTASHEEISNKQIYSTCVKDLIVESFNGIDTTIFAYGQTGAGELLVFLIFGNVNLF